MKILLVSSRNSPKVPSESTRGVAYGNFPVFFAVNPPEDPSGNQSERDIVHKSKNRILTH